jgi:FkbM family methyltransferase
VTFDTNIGFVEIFTSRLIFVGKFFFILRNFRKAFKNHLLVLYRMVRHSYPIQCTLKDGSHVNVKTERELWYLMLIQNNLLKGQDYEIYMDLKNETATITSKDPKSSTKVLGCVNNGDLWGIFVKGEYSSLNVRRRTVVDIGANIGDSSIYFALQGAKRVIALEPFSANYEVGLRNIQYNNLANKIFFMMAGISSTSGKTRVANIDAQDSNTLSYIKQTTAGNGLEVSLFTLKDLVDRFHVEPDSVLKIDCEGCEYDFILSIDSSYLGKFNSIILEYHYGYKNLRKKLIEAGFKVSHQHPTHWKQPKENRSLYTGLLFGFRS